MKPGRNESVLYGTVKTDKFEHLKDITVVQLKFWPIIDRTGTFTPNAAKVISII